MDKIYKLNLDKDFSDFILTHFNSIFKNIHPNYITFIGLIANFGIFYYSLNNNFISTQNSFIKNYFIEICIFIKFITDILDGSVARKYNKKSKIGNFLDSIADSIFFILSINFILKKYNISIQYNILAFIFILSYSHYFNMFDNHDNLKQNKISGFIANNSIFVCFILIKLYQVYLK